MNHVNVSSKHALDGYILYIMFLGLELQPHGLEVAFFTVFEWIWVKKKLDKLLCEKK